MRTVILVQARMRSTRLPGKVLMPVLEKPILGHLVERLHRVRQADEVVIATTVEPIDDAIVAWCKQNRVAFFRGDEHNVLERFYQAAKEYRADTVLRICSDCPLIDPDIVDAIIRHYQARQPQIQYVSNSLQRTFPIGMDAEVFSLGALERTYREATEPGEKEHVTPYIYCHPERFAQAQYVSQKAYPPYRLTLDTPEDFELIRRIFEHLYPQNPAFGLQDIIDLLSQHPEWAALNANIQQKSWKKTL